MRWALRTLWSCSTGFRAYPTLITASARQLWSYLLTIVCVHTLVMSVPLGRICSRQMAEIIAWAQQLPTITIVQGTATVVEPQPIRLERRDVAGVGDLEVVVDTTGQTSTLPEPAGIGVLITAHDVVLQQGRARRSYDFRPVQRLVIDDAWITRWGRALTRWLCGLLPLILLLYGLVARSGQALLWSGVAWLAMRLRGGGLAFGVIWRLAVFALGPPLMFATAVEALLHGETNPLLWVIYLLVYAVMFSGALTAAQRAKFSTDADAG